MKTDNIPDALKALEAVRRTARTLIGQILCEIGKDPKAVKAWHRSLRWQNISARGLADGLSWFNGDHPHRQVSIKDNEISFSIHRSHFTLSLDLFTGTAEEIKAGLLKHWNDLYESEKQDDAQSSYRKFLALKSRFENPRGFDKKAKDAQDKSDRAQASEDQEKLKAISSNG